jgi:hypothetical protein
VSCELEAFESFRSWLYTGVYENPQIVGNHLYAYWLAEHLHSNNFANAVMKKILEEIPARKYDQDLKDSYRHIWSNVKADSPLRKLFFNCAVFWKLEFGGGGHEAPKSTYGEGVLGLDPEKDSGLFLALKKHKNSFCGCSAKMHQTPSGRQSRPARNRRGNRRAPITDLGKLLGNSLLHGVCKCQIAPWILEPNGYFIRA